MVLSRSTLMALFHSAQQQIISFAFRQRDLSIIYQKQRKHAFRKEKKKERIFKFWKMKYTRWSSAKSLLLSDLLIQYMKKLMIITKPMNRRDYSAHCYITTSVSSHRFQQKNSRKSVRIFSFSKRMHKLGDALCPIIRQPPHYNVNQ